MQTIHSLLFGMVLLTGLFQGPSPYEWSKKSALSTDHQVEFPGIVLEPGDYVVRLRESGEKRSFVQVLNRDETQVLASLVAVPDLHARPDDAVEFTFHEVKDGGPQPVHSWFFSGDVAGLEFVYSKPRAIEIARSSNEHVIASNGGNSSKNKEGALIAVTPSGGEIVLDERFQRTAIRKVQ